MEHRGESDSRRESLYDIQLRSRPPHWLRSKYPSMTVTSTAAQTALRRRVSGPGQLDALFQKLRSVGLVLMDVHRVPAASDTSDPDSAATARRGSGTYEVRVEGELGAPMLRFLRWRHYVVPEQTLLRVAVASEDLNDLLRECTDAGASIERVRRVDPSTGRQRAHA